MYELFDALLENSYRGANQRGTTLRGTAKLNDLRMPISTSSHNINAPGLPLDLACGRRLLPVAPAASIRPCFLFVFG